MGFPALDRDRVKIRLFFGVCHAPRLLDTHTGSLALELRRRIGPERANVTVARKSERDRERRSRQQTA